MTFFSWRWAAVAVGAMSFASAGWLACGGNDAVAVDAGPDATDDATSIDASPPVDSAAPDSSGSGGDAGCTDDAGLGACRKCCTATYPAASAAFRDLERACACQTGRCEARCATTLCAVKPSAPDAVCAACLDDTDAGACRITAGAECLQDAGCAPFIACDLGCVDGG